MSRIGITQGVLSQGLRMTMLRRHARHMESSGPVDTASYYKNNK